MKTSNAISHAANASVAALLLVGCSAGASSPTDTAGLIPAGPAPLSRVGQTTREAHRISRAAVRPDTCAGNALYFADYTNSVIDSFGAAGGDSACTVTPKGLSNPIGIWVQPVSGTYNEDLFAANAGNGTAVAYKTPLTGTSLPMWQFNVGSAASDVVQDQFGNVYVAVYGTPNIDVFSPPFDSCAYLTGCAPSYSITDPCGSVYWLATDGKGDVYSNNYCGYVTLFTAPISAGAVGTELSGVSYEQPGGMIVDKRNELVVNDPATGKINVYGLNVLRATAQFRYGLSPYSGVIAGIGLDRSNKFLWGANTPPMAGQRYAFRSGGGGGTPTATDPTLVDPMGAAARPSSAE